MTFYFFAARLGMSAAPIILGVLLVIAVAAAVALGVLLYKCRHPTGDLVVDCDKQKNTTYSEEGGVHYASVNIKCP